MASPTRIPVTARSPIKVRYVADLSGKRSVDVAAIKATTSASEYR
jgi:hypothetical protein